jgi:HK97 family phage prohead protease
MDRLTFGLDLKELSDNGAFEGYASVFGNADMGGDVVERGAFKDTLASRGPSGVKMLLDHDPRQRVGVWEDVKEDDRGLYVKGRLLMEKQIARDAYVDLKAGALDQMSIGYRVAPKGYEYDEQSRVRKLKSLDLFEVSLVTFAMNPEARVTGVKAGEEIKTIREFEDFLRDVGGFSHGRAKAIATQGFKAAEPRDEAGADELAEVIRRNIATLTI